MVLAIQIIGSLFGLFMIYYSFLQFKRNEFTGKEFGFWFLIWLMFIIVSIFPNILDPFVVFVGVLRALDLLVIIGFIFMVTAIFYTYTLVRKSQKKLENLVRELAIKKGKRK